MEKQEASRILQSKLHRTTEALAKLELNLMEPDEALKHSEPPKSEADEIKTWAKQRIAAQQ